MALLDAQTYLTGIKVQTSGSQPAASASNRGQVWVVQGGTGVADVFQICMKGTANTYTWVTIATAP